MSIAPAWSQVLNSFGVAPPPRLPLADAARLFHLLGEPTRLRTLLPLAGRGEVFADDLAEAIGRSQSAPTWGCSAAPWWYGG
jgi:hypothetical protein